MGKSLVITEKPSVARDIVAAIGGFSEKDGYWEGADYVVTYAVGHLFELPAPEDMSPEYRAWTLNTLPILPPEFRFRDVAPKLKPKSGTRDRLSTIRSLLQRKDVDRLVNACDAGREGELIFREIVEHFESTQPIQRLWLQSMTRDAIRRGFDELQDGVKYEGLSNAAHCRNYSDWVIGMNATRALTRRLKSRSENQAWSAGRVQTPTLAMLVHRELDILAHTPKPFWRIRASFQHADETYEALWFDPTARSSGEDDDQREDRLFDEAKAREIVEKTRGKMGVASETQKPSRDNPPLLFDLTSLQREANSRFGWSARRTLNAAQRCYEGHKVLTYPRTDAKALPNDYRPVVNEVIEQLGRDPRFTVAARRLKSAGLLNTEKIFDDAKVTDHFAIVPTGTLATHLSGDDARLFDLVARRFLAAFFRHALWTRIDRVTVVEGERFRSRARVLVEPGWREVMGETEGEGKLTPFVAGKELVEGVSVDPHEVGLEEEQTKPPNRITEARLLSLMEGAGKYVEDEETAEAMRESGIGTPATRADIIENLISKGYVLRAARALKPTVKGIRLIDILHRMKAERLASPALTGELERHLNLVERGRMGSAEFMDEIYEYAEEIVDLTKNFEFESLYPDEQPLGHCPCEKKRPVYERSWFYRCKEPDGLDTNMRRRKKAIEAGEDVVEDCSFRVWKDKSGRYIERQSVLELLESERTRPLDGFMTRQGKTYRGFLTLVGKDVELERLEASGEADEASEAPEYEVDETPVGKCPVCQEGDVVETRGSFVCTRGLAVLRALERDEASTLPIRPSQVPEDLVYCAFVLPRTVCKREVTRAESETYIRDHKTPILEDFTSKKGRPFSAMLVLRDTGRMGFEFPPRGRDARPGPEDGTTAGAGAAPKKASKKGKSTAKKRGARGDGETSEEVPKTSAKKKVSSRSATSPTPAKKKTSKKKSTSKA
ncbi:MAG: hypothetical protein HC923_13195, partial [Myxococcales bacterium]|nr:hypothetical protein [Myxococcales bacterium]